MVSAQLQAVQEVPKGEALAQLEEVAAIVLPPTESFFLFHAPGFLAGFFYWAQATSGQHREMMAMASPYEKKRYWWAMASR